MTKPKSTLGGGYIVRRRGRSGRLSISAGHPFEHPTLAAAIEEAHRLTTIQPGHSFEVYGLQYVAAAVAADQPAAEAAE